MRVVRVGSDSGVESKRAESEVLVVFFPFFLSFFCLMSKAILTFSSQKQNLPLSCGIPKSESCAFVAVCWFCFLFFGSFVVVECVSNKHERAARARQW